MKSSERLIVRNIHKNMGAIRALVDVSFSVPHGTVHGIIGHNGSGKSTLVKILADVLQADRGSYHLEDGEGPRSGEPRVPRVAAVFQDLGLADNLPVLDNLLANTFRATRLRYLNMARERSRARAAMSAVGLDLPLDVDAGQLPEAERVMLCVARAMMRAGLTPADGAHDAGRHATSADLLVMDEPTSSLPREELERFRDLVRRLRDEAGITMLVVTHNPTDIGAFCDEFTALKDGRVLCTQPAAGVTSSMLAELMAGQSGITQETPRAPEAGPEPASGRPTASPPLFWTDKLMTEQISEPVTLSARAGELVGITGLEGSGFREFVRAAMGVRDVTSGGAFVEGRRLSGRTRHADAVFIPADRARTSGVPSATVYENMTMGRVGAYAKNGFINRRQERSAVAAMLRRLRVSPADPRRILSQLSGGQQQKTVVGRALLSSAKLLVFEEPTAAVDVGARESILKSLQEVAREGNAVIVASGEFEWMSAVCDRIVVFRLGGVAGELARGQMGEEAILRLAYGD